MPLAATKSKPRLASALTDFEPATAPLWQGPCGAGPQGGITQGLLSRWFVCPERFRIYTVEGLRPAEQFSHRLEYGNMWHVCEEGLARKDNFGPGSKSTMDSCWVNPLTKFCTELCRRFPLQQQEVNRWYNVCKTQFPLYAQWWSQHPDVKDRTPLLAEQVFDVPYKLPSGRVARLRGKWDSVDLVGTGRKAGMWLQENKSKGDIDEPQLRRQLSSGFDLQTMLYMVALLTERNRTLSLGLKVAKLPELGVDAPVMGVRYNVIRRPLSGGRGSISQREATQGARCNLKSCREQPDPACEKCGGAGRVGAKPAETDAEFSARLSDVIRNAHGPEWGMPAGEHFFFMRWNVAVTPADVERFRRECLDPVLENLADDFEWWELCKQAGLDRWDAKRRRVEFVLHQRRHFVTPFGIYNTLAEGGGTDLDEHLRTGSKVGLHRAADLFPELK